MTVPASASSALSVPWAGPVTIAMLNFLVIKSVSSSEFNMPLVFIFLGFMFAIAYRQRMRGAAAPFGASLFRINAASGRAVPA